jgi:hypothetical protein
MGTALAGKPDDVSPPNDRLLTAEESRTALYVDFESRENEEPVVVGILTSGEAPALRQVVLDRDFTSAAEAKGLAVSTIPDVVHELALSAEGSSRCVVAWSTNEWKVFARHGTDHDKDVLRAAYRNGIPLARAWRSRFAPEWTPPRSPIPNRGRHTLDAYMKKLGYEVPVGCGPYNTGRRLKDLRDMLVRWDFEYTRLTPVAKRKWTMLLCHNEHDCRGMQFVCMRCAGDLEREV